MDDTIEKTLKEIAQAKKEKKESEKCMMQNLERLGWYTRHFRTKNNGNCTVLYRRGCGGKAGSELSKYRFLAMYSFCSPNDTFCKRKGRVEAYNNKEFTMYLPPLKPHADRITVQHQIDNMLLGFIRNIVSQAEINSKNRYDYEQYFGFPRWINEFLNAYSNPYRSRYAGEGLTLCIGNPNHSDDFWNRAKNW